MKRQWTPEELIAQWTLLPRDLTLLANKHGPTRLGFAVLLLSFQQEGYFERSRLEYHLGVDGGTILLGLLGSTFWDLHQDVVLAHPELDFGNVS